MESETLTKPYKIAIISITLILFGLIAVALAFAFLSYNAKIIEKNGIAESKGPNMQIATTVKNGLLAASNGGFVSGTANNVTSALVTGITSNNTEPIASNNTILEVLGKLVARSNIVNFIGTTEMKSTLSSGEFNLFTFIPGKGSAIFPAPTVAGKTIYGMLSVSLIQAGVTPNLTQFIFRIRIGGQQIMFITVGSNTTPSTIGLVCVEFWLQITTTGTCTGLIRGTGHDQIYQGFPLIASPLWNLNASNEVVFASQMTGTLGSQIYRSLLLTSSPDPIA